MPIIYSSNEQIAIEIKKLLLDSKMTQREVAAKLEIKPQGLTKLLSKKNFGFEDADRILSAMGYQLSLDFVRIPTAVGTGVDPASEISDDNTI
ncbi:MAG: helix-turn-helix domain-containing protein [Clostridiales bacterium]|nr:helix-turn-helix domain-containing protein [Clostridiales bacterium]